MYTCSAFLVLLALAGVPAAASEPGCGTGDIPLGDLYLSFAPDAYERYNCDEQIGPFSPFDFYLVVDIDYCECGDCSLNTTAGLQAWEAQLDLSAVPPGDLTIISATLSPSTSSNFGSPPDKNFLVGTGGTCVTGDEFPAALVTFRTIIGNPLGTWDVRIDLIEASPPSRLSPGWNQCGPPEGILYSFYSITDPAPPADPRRGRRGFENAYIVINPGHMCLGYPIESTSWGDVKSRYNPKD